MEGFHFLWRAGMGLSCPWPVPADRLIPPGDRDDFGFHFLEGSVALSRSERPEWCSRGCYFPQHSQPPCLSPSGFCFSPCSPVPEIPLDSFHSRCISPPSLTLPKPAHLLGFDLHDLNDHKNRDFFCSCFLKALLQPSKQK